MTTTTDTGLTREQIKAMRNADSAVFRFTKDGYDYPGTIELQKEIKRGDGFGNETLRVEIPAVAMVTNYGGSRFSDDPEGSELDPAIAGTWVFLSLSVRPDWHTIVAFLKPGDVLTQGWTVDNRNTLLKRAQLTSHELVLRVDRPTKDGSAKRYVFNLDTATVSPHNSADLVQRERKS